MAVKNLYIDGAWIEGSGPMFSSINPATGESVWVAQRATDYDVVVAVLTARHAFQSWASLSVDERKKYLEQFAESLAGQRDEFAVLISQETGKPLWESLTEVDAMVKKVEISVKAYEERCRESSGPMGQATQYTRYKPHGVVAVLGPFNLPGHLPNGHIVPSLLAGNTVVFKPSELTPAVGQQIAEIWDEVGLPHGVINLVQGGKETGIALVKCEDIDGLFFTGSAETGAAIHQTLAGRPELILALEMGGNNPLVVCEAKNLEAAAYLTIQSAFITSGQRCVCARRLIVLQGTEGDAFMKVFLGMARKISVGAYTDRPQPFMGPVISNDAAGKLLATQEEMMRKGGKFFLKMSPLEGKPAMLTPGVMDVTEVSARPDREIFGPFLQVIRVKDFDAAIVEANRTAYGLSAGLLSDNPELYKRFLKSSRAGIVNWNRQITGASSSAPFGGVGKSGNHRPSAYFAADYCSYPVASIEQNEITMPEKLSPGLDNAL